MAPMRKGLLATLLLFAAVAAALVALSSSVASSPGGFSQGSTGHDADGFGHRRTLAEPPFGLKAGTFGEGPPSGRGGLGVRVLISPWGVGDFGFFMCLLH
jgi:hypothetical protein